jgi:mannose/cellobiose epimerase-like protein (N-acyl-D-glucosamine 2-epimerase family)
MTVPPAPDPAFDSCDPGFRGAQARAILAWAFPRAIDHQFGGFITTLDDHGSYDPLDRHLVQQTRYTLSAALGHRLGLLAGLDAAADHGLAFLRGPMRDREHGGWFWDVRGADPADPAKYAYGHAFVLLAAATCLDCGVPTRDLLDDAWDVLETRFWRESDGLYADRCSPDWGETDPYRGQNANMHMVEALLAAHAATGEVRFLDRAETVARRVIVDLGAETGGFLWEHYDEDWRPDLSYNRDTPRDMFRPWGVLSGHLMEWAKLLVLLDASRPLPWALPEAERLFALAIAHGWDEEHGGLIYSFDLQDVPVDTDKYHWTIAEAIGAAALLHGRTGHPAYREWHARFWHWALDHQIDRERGGWFPGLSRDGSLLDLPFARGKPEIYHPLGACLASCGDGQPGTE